MQVGFGEADITPPLGAPMMGQLIAYPNVGVESPLKALATVVYDETSRTTAVFVVADLLMFSNELAAEARSAVSTKLEVDVRCVVLSATHTHSGPSTMPLFGQEENSGYREQLLTG